MLCCVIQMFVMLVKFRRIVTSQYTLTYQSIYYLVDTFISYCCKRYVNFGMFALRTSNISSSLHFS